MAHQVVLDAYNWERYSTEVLAGCNLADQAFLEKFNKATDFHLPLTKNPLISQVSFAW